MYDIKNKFPRKDLLVDDTLPAEKLAQARSSLTPGDLWLILSREGSDPAVSLLLGRQLVGELALWLTVGEAGALVSGIDAGHLEGLCGLSIQTYRFNLYADLQALLGRLAPQRILLDVSPADALCDGLTAGLRDRLEALAMDLRPAPLLASSENILRRLRSVKVAAELARIQAATAQTAQLYAALLPQLRQGMREREIQDLVNRLASQLGYQIDAGDFGGPLVLISRAGMSHRAPGETQLEAGDLLILDTSLVVHGFRSDLARTFYALPEGAEQPPAELQRMFSSIRRATEAARSALRPGVPGWVVDAAARQSLIADGWPEIRHSTGHQIGRRVHDGGTILGPPGRSPLVEGTVLAGEIYALEPTVLLSPGPSMIVEESVLVGEEQTRYLSPLQEELWPIPRVGGA
jgi:Xaa-Pro aminopeptidase